MSLSTTCRSRPPGLVRVGVTSAGICGSDLHVFHAALGDPAGLRPGHEVAGIVDSVGDGSEVGVCPWVWLIHEGSH